VTDFFSTGVIFKGVVVCIPWAHVLSAGIVKMQHVTAFVTGLLSVLKGASINPSQWFRSLFLWPACMLMT